MREERKRKRNKTSKQHTSNSSNLVEEATPQILFLDAKPLCYFYGCVISSGCVFKKIRFSRLFPLFRNENRIFIQTGIKQESSALFWTYRNS